MKLKKALCTLVALTVVGTAFAGNAANFKLLANQSLNFKTLNLLKEADDDMFRERSRLEYTINTALLQAEQLPLYQPITQEEDKMAVRTAAAMRAGLLAYERELTAGKTLSAKSQKIQNSLKQLINILNSMESSYDEVADQMSPLLIETSADIISNQNKIGYQETEISVAALDLLYFVYTHGYVEGTLLIRVTPIMQNLFQELLQQGQGF